MYTETKEPRFIKLIYDTTLKYFYKNEKYRPWFDNIIKKKFGIDLTGYEIVDNELNTGNIRKDYRLDIRLKKDDVNVIIEANSDYYKFLDNKNYQYLYRVAGNMYDSGENYSNKQAKLVLFNNYKSSKIEELKTANYKLRDIGNNLEIEDIESYEIYLPNFKEMCYHKANEEDVSLSLFTCSSYEEMKRKTNNQKDLEIIKELERLAMDEKFIFDYDSEAVKRKTENSIRLEAREDGYNEGHQEGLEQGRNEKSIEIAKNLIASGINVEIISKSTGLTISEIENLK